MCNGGKSALFIKRVVCFENTLSARLLLSQMVHKVGSHVARNNEDTLEEALSYLTEIII